MSSATEQLRSLLAERPGAGSPVIMGVVNVTPDSFSDGGSFLDPERAIEHGLELIEQGAHLVDVGGESTRPGAQRPSAEEELARVIPVIEGLAGRGALVSIDSMRAQVAQAAVAAGAVLVNDVSGGLADPQMAQVVAAAGVPMVVMHWRGHSDVMESQANYLDVTAQVRSELAERVDDLIGQGVSREQLILDPGLGFAKTAEHNWQVMAGLSSLTGPQGLGLPVLLGASRKRFLGSVGRAPGRERPVDQRDRATAASSLLAAQAGVWGVRVHDVVGTRDALDVWAALRQSNELGQEG